MSSAQTTPKIFFNLQALRFLAALAVATFHTEIFYRKAGGTWVIDPLRVGYARIDLFFVISGFVTTHVAGSIQTPRQVGSFLYRRFARIFTAYWPVMLLMLSIFWFFAPDSLGRFDFLKGLVLIHASDASRIVATSWTLTQELLFYLVFGAACLLPRRTLPVAAVLFVAVVIGNQFIDRTYKLPILLSPLLLEFMLGAGMRMALDRVRFQAGLPHLVASVACLFVCAYVCRQVGVTLFTRALIVGPAAAILVFTVANFELRGATVSKRISSMGDYAYGIYLVHWPMLVVAGFTIQEFVVRHRWSAELVYGLILAATVPVAIAFHHFLELPLFRLATSWTKREEQRALMRGGRAIPQPATLSA